jgi:ubiquitin thioesterase OTU1
MRARYKGPSGTGVLELPDDAAVGNIFEEITLKTGLSDFTLKYGWPLKTLEPSQKDAIAKSLGLSGETFTIVPGASDEGPKGASSTRGQDQASVQETSTSQSSGRPNKRVRVEEEASRARGPEGVSVAWPDRGGTLREFCLCFVHLLPRRTLLHLIVSSDSSLARHA